MTEVVLAIGIVAFAMVSILGLVSLSEQASKGATDQTNLALMTQTVSTLLRTSGTSGFQTPYTAVTSLLSGSGNSVYYLNYYFDASGAPSRDTLGNLISGSSTLIASGSNVSSAVTKPTYVCTVMNKTPSATGVTNYVSIPQEPSNFAFAYLRLDFAWPYGAPAANQQHKYAYTSVTSYY